MKGLSINTYGDFKKEVRPLPFHYVPIEHDSMTTVFLGVKQERSIFLRGNNKDDLTLEDCLPWDKFVHLGDGNVCAKICVPVFLQLHYNVTIGRPKCHNAFEHNCMATRFPLVRIK